MPDGNLITDPVPIAVRPAEVRTPGPVPVERGSVPLAAVPGRAPSPALRVEDFTAGELREVATAFSDVVSVVNRDLRILIDESTGRVVTQIVDSETNEVVRQLPPEALLDVARRVADLVGLLLDEES